MSLNLFWLGKGAGSQISALINAGLGKDTPQYGFFIDHWFCPGGNRAVRQSEEYAREAVEFN